MQKEPTPESKSLLHHYKLSKYIDVAKDIEPPQLLPTEWTYKPLYHLHTDWTQL